MFAATSHSRFWTYLVAITCAQLLTSADQKNITAESGQNVTLPCRAPNSNNIEVVEWSRADLGTEYVLLRRDEQFDAANQHPSFKDRVYLQDREMNDGDVSLILKNVTAADDGTYECHVIQDGTNRRKRSVYGTKPISIINLRVDPPGPPGGLTEDGSVGLGVGLSVYAVLFAAAAVVVL